MTMKEILTLVAAGYTKEDIEKMEAPAAPEPAAPAPAPTPDPEPAAPAPAPVPDPAPAAPAQAENEPTMRDLMQSMAKLTSAIQANAIAQSVVPGGNQGPTAEDAIAQIIRPTFKERSI